MRSIARFSLILAAALAATGFARGADAEPKLTVVDAGTGAKSELRYDIPAGAAQDCVMAMRMTVNQTMGGMPMPAQVIPEMRTPSAVHVTERAGENAKYEIVTGQMEVVDDGTAPKSMIDMLRQAFEGSGGMKVYGSFDSRGIHQEMTVEAPADANPGLQQQMSQSAESMKQMSMPMPEAAVGVGAKWTIEQAIDMNGMKIAQTTTCTLKEHTGSVITLDIEISQTADPQSIVNPQAPQMDIRLQSLEGHGKGTVKIDLSRMMPLESKVESEMSTKMSIDAMGQKQVVDQVMQMKMSLESKDAPAAP